MNKALVWTIRFVLGLGILFLLIFKIGLEEIISTLTSMNLVFLLPIFALYFLNLFLGAVTISLLLRVKAKSLKFRELVRYYLLSWGVGLFVPGRMGEVSLVYFLKKHKIPLGEGFLIFVLDKFISFVFIALVAAFGFYYFDVSSYSYYTNYAFFGFLLLLLFGGAIIFTNFGRSVIKKYVLRKYSEKFKGFSILLSYFMVKKPHLLLGNFIMTCIRWAISAFVYSLVFLSFGEEISFLVIFVFTAITSAMSFIPLTVSGIGIREAVAVFLYSTQGIAQPVVVSTYLVMVMAAYCMAALIFYFSNYKGLLKG